MNAIPPVPASRARHPVVAFYFLAAFCWLLVDPAQRVEIVESAA